MAMHQLWDSGKKYDPLDELHVDSHDPRSVSIAQRAQTLYEDFASAFRKKLDLGDPRSILGAYNEATHARIFEEAAFVREHFFGKDIHFYGVVYLWDMCIEGCTYCPAAVENRKKAKYKPLELTIEDAVREVRYVMGDGHRHLCILTGEDPVRHAPAVLAEYIRAFDDLGLEEMILNVEPPRDPLDWKLWRQAARKTSLQFRVFQETYDRETYSRIHPITKHGRKHDFENRYNSQIAAVENGFENYGLGVLFGNHRLPIAEIDGLQEHARYARTKTGKWPARVNLPSAKHLENIAVDIPFDLHLGVSADADSKRLYRMSSELLYALARLALPQISIVSSERDSPDLLRVLDRYATCTTLNVHPGVGDNIRFNEGIDFMTPHFEQAPSFSRDPRTANLDFVARGYRTRLAPIVNGSVHDRALIPRTVNLQRAHAAS